jgi:hypothetical protein
MNPGSTVIVPGVYRATISFANSGLFVRSIEVTTLPLNSGNSFNPVTIAFVCFTASGNR